MSSLDEVQPVHVATYVEALGRRMSAPSVKQHLACIGILFHWLVTGQVVLANPAQSVHGPWHSISKGVTPVLSSEEMTALLSEMEVSTVMGLRDRVIIAVMSYTLACVGVVMALNAEDYFLLKECWWLRLREKNGKRSEMPWHHKLEAFLDAYMDAAGIERDRKGLLFRATIGKTKELGPGRMSRTDVWYMMRHRASDASNETAMGCHTFRTTAITD